MRAHPGHFAGLHVRRQLVDVKGRREFDRSHLESEVGGSLAKGDAGQQNGCREGEKKRRENSVFHH